MKNSQIGRSRQIFEALMATAAFDAGLKADIVAGKKRIADHVIYSVRSFSEKLQEKMFKDDDKKVVGITNLSSAKMEKNQVMVATGIQLLSAEGKGVSGEEKGLDYGVIADEIANGEFTLKVNGSEMIQKSSLLPFKTTDTMAQIKGFVELENPIVILSQVPIDLQIETGVACEEHTFVKVALYGSIVSL
jgi:hypothetical protein